MTHRPRWHRAFLLGLTLTVWGRDLHPQAVPPAPDPCNLPARSLAQAAPPPPSPCLVAADRMADCLAAQDAELRHYRTLASTTDNVHSNPGSPTFVESATAIEAWSVAVGNKSSLQAYQFPVTLAVNPLRLLDPYDERWRRPIWRNLAQSQLSATYAPVVVQPRPGKVPGVVESAARTVAGSYKVVILGTDEMEDNLKALTALGDTGLQLALNDPVLAKGATAAPGSEERKAFDAARSRCIVAALPALQGDLKRQLMLAVKLTYQGDSRPVKPNAVAAELDVSKILGQQGTPLADTPLGLGGSLSSSWFGRSSVGATYQQTSVDFGPTVTVKKVLDLSIQGQVDRYTGRGFQGIPGVVDTRRRTDIGLAQAVKFQLPINADLTLSVKELHLGTGNTDVALAALLAFKPRPPHPKLQAH